MRYRARFSDPDNLNVEMTISMPLRDWRFIRRDLSADSVQSQRLIDVLYQIITQLDSKVEDMESK